MRINYDQYILVLVKRYHNLSIRLCFVYIISLKLSILLLTFWSWSNTVGNAILSNSINFVPLYNLLRCEVRSMNSCTVQGIVRPPSGWLNPNSSSVWFIKSRKADSLRYDTKPQIIFFVSAQYKLPNSPLGR